jgi:CRISPR-associated protein Csd2
MKFDPTKKLTIVCYNDITLGNPNGDPDNDGNPRMLPDNRNYINNSCLIRKFRNFAAFNGSPILLVAESGIDTMLENSYKAIGVSKEPDSNQKTQLTNSFKDKFVDVRLFGAMLSTSSKPANNVKTPVSVQIAKSLDPVNIVDIAITACYGRKDSAASGGRNQNIGKKHVVEYALYKYTVEYCPQQGLKANTTSEDLKLLIEMLQWSFDCDRSASRDIRVQKIFAFEHTDTKVQTQVLEDLIKVECNLSENEEFPTSIKNYKIDINPEDVPEGIDLTIF